MRYLFFFLLFSLFTMLPEAGAQTKRGLTDTSKAVIHSDTLKVRKIRAEPIPEIYEFVDQEPEFPGGYNALLTYFKQNMKYPANAQKQQVQGIVHVNALVGADGRLSGIKIAKEIEGLNEEALRLLNNMPVWTQAV